MAAPRTGSGSAIAAERPARRPRFRWGWRRVLLAALGGVAGLFVALPVGRYLLRAGWEEAKILAARRPIATLVADSTLDERTRAKLRLVLAARAYARDSLGLEAGESFTTYTQLKSDTLVLLVQAAYRDRLQRYTWWFPIVGRVPYKGYFDRDAARREGARLAGQGLDVDLRPASAFSTLGVFNDPLLSTTLRADSLELANTVIHEITHNSIYLPGQAVFNESFANFVGARGAARLFRARRDSMSTAETDARWSDTRLLAGFWAALYHSVDSAYAAHPTDRAARIAARDSVGRRARRELTDVLGPRLRTVGPRTLERMRLGNAALLSRRVYMTDLDLFDAVYARERYDLRRTIERVRSLALGSPRDPYGAVRRWLGSAGETAPQQRAQVQ